MKSWIYAARLHTLPLCLSGIFLSVLLAWSQGKADWQTFLLCSLTGLHFQVLANFANDYGDSTKGVDDDGRIGPKRAIQSGLISKLEMKRAILLVIVLSLICSYALVYRVFGFFFSMYSMIFFGLAIFSIYAAIAYTVGPKSYGYRGWGDLAVFVFFGLIPVQGSYFLYTQSFEKEILLLAVSLGLFSTAVLNLNNMRDVENDKKKGKRTLVVKIGAVNARIYHAFLILIPFVLGFFFVMLRYRDLVQFAFLILLVPCILHLKKVFRCSDLRTLDLELKKVSLIAFLYGFLIGIFQVLPI